jgi:ribosomal-protein-alanine N-acetyltransferase
MPHSDKYKPLTTARLLLRRFTDSDIPAFAAYRSDPEVARYQTWSGCTEEDARHFVAEMKSVPCGVRGLGFQLAVEHVATGTLIGDCYFKVDRSEPRSGEIGFSLARAFQRQGYATEAVGQLLDFLFDDLELHRVTAIADCRNDRSVALMERLGMRREGHFLQCTWFKGAWSDEFQYAILKDEWLGCRASA